MASADLSKIGAQSFSFRHFDAEGAVQRLDELGLLYMEFCAVHFKPDISDPGFATLQDLMKTHKLEVPCFGVEQYGGDADANRKKFEFGKALEVEVLTADPAPEAFDSLDRLCEEFQIKIAIHNHGPKARYDRVEDTLKAIEGRHPFIGACVDTGHAIRSGEAPEEVIRALGDRVHSIHLKDWEFNSDETILGEGDLNLERVVAALQEINFSGPIMMEFELDEDNPVPGMIRGLQHWGEHAW